MMAEHDRPLVFPKKAQGVPVFTSQGVLAVMDIYRRMIGALDAASLDYQGMLTSDVITKMEFEQYFGDRFAGTLIAASDTQWLAPESNLLTFPQLLSDSAIGRLHLSLVQRFRIQPRAIDLFRDSHIWPCLGLNGVFPDCDMNVERLRGIYEAVLTTYRLPIVSVRYARDDYGEGYILCGRMKTEGWTGLAMIFELGPLFRRHWDQAYRYFNSGLTGKVLHYADQLVGEQVAVSNDLEFDGNALVALCAGCIKRVGMIDVGETDSVPEAPCLVCHAPGPIHMVSKRNNFY
jgi:hypothetical protein